jgi:hypothetical protein
MEYWNIGITGKNAKKYLEATPSFFNPLFQRSLIPSFQLFIGTKILKQR